MAEGQARALEAAPLLRDPAVAGLDQACAVWLAAKDGPRLRAALFPAPEPRGSVLLSPGRSEHIEKYLEVAGELVGRGYSVLVHDWRGQGLSQRLLDDPLRGHAAGFDAFLDDYDLLFETFEASLPRPRVAMGHSMGGCLTLLALERDATRFDAAILSAPMLGIRTGDTPSWLARLVARVMVRTGHAGDYVKGAKAYDPAALVFETDRLTHDRARYDRTRAQIAAQHELALGDVTWGWLDSALSGAARVRGSRRLSSIVLPVTIVAAGQDRLVDSGVSQAVARRLPHGRFVQLPGAYHEILMETDDIRQDFWAEFDALVAAIPPPG